MRVQLDEHGITQAQYSILATLSYLLQANEIVTQQDVANQLSMDKMMVSDVVKTLVKNQWVVRSENAKDSRSFALSVTEKASKLLKTVTPVVENTDEKFFSLLSKSERSQFILCLNKLNE